ncbi:hypothetical protein B0T21DRAFT_377419 [Apiosordaria backusii]|uniref:Uncharacterized protein n=1 Tax=Apiosordaria backusii TaxID=314023 RepID=A0AA40DND8_9PEZI|nr:hypothetical protein B0T21DRAFT_377419 [Apiosordaria backusii]
MRGGAGTTPQSYRKDTILSPSDSSVVIRPPIIHHSKSPIHHSKSPVFETPTPFSPTTPSLFLSPNMSSLISGVHIVFLQCAEAAADLPPNPDNPPCECLSDLTNLQVRATNTVATGVHLPDGLTAKGATDCLDFVEDVKRKLDNVYLLASSPLNRAIETVQGVQPAFKLVGPFHPPRGQDNGWLRGLLAPPHPLTPLETSIYVHPGLREATNRPPDLPGTPVVQTLDNGLTRRYASLLRVRGGTGEDALTILPGEQKVDLTRLVWPGGNPWHTRRQRMLAVIDTPKIADIEAAAREARIWLRKWAARVLSAHQERGGRGTPRIVVFTHGGIMNFLMQQWHTDHRQRLSDGRWVFHSPTVLNNLDATVFTFDSMADDDAVLRELPRNAYYTRTLGQYYRHLGSDPSRPYRNPDGRLLDQKAAHRGFIEDTAEEVQDLGLRWWSTLVIFSNWIGLGRSQELHTVVDPFRWDDEDLVVEEEISMDEDSGYADEEEDSMDEHLGYTDEEEDFMDEGLGYTDEDSDSDGNDDDLEMHDA